MKVGDSIAFRRADGSEELVGEVARVWRPKLVRVSVALPGPDGTVREATIDNVALCGEQQPGVGYVSDEGPAEMEAPSDEQTAAAEEASSASSEGGKIFVEQEVKSVNVGDEKGGA